MGEESTLPTVEEAAEPPIRNLQSVNYDEPTSAGQHPTLQPQSRKDSPPESLAAPHTLTATQVAQALDVDISNGLSSSEAERRLGLHGPNTIKGADGLSLWEIFLRQVSNSLTLVSDKTMHSNSTDVRV
ncbi:hypothetical protein BCR34DRAFT_207746 [Clohesyomyces aquaticus]|uniref:Cation-transporting P-type ATPase N-terminal domain-containing protein n=1 Tax=Clohesyomyces aquaticus TaxID=1231657 RepID=A0A1Y2A9J9_9PLEO|nr:hypothetical protein BCR34DRAFT_207746 [Clohesyomyces aquaticus]